MNIRLRNRKITLLLPLVLILSTGLILAQEIKSTVDPKQDFSKYRKYAWRKTSVGNTMVPDEIQKIERAIINAGNRELAQKGYQEDSANPDFYIEVATLGTQDVNMSGKAGYIYQYSGEVTNPQFGYAPGTDMWLTLTSRGSIVVTDRGTNATVWQAETRKEYKNPGRALKNLDEEVSSVMKKALKSFPARKK